MRKTFGSFLALLLAGAGLTVAAPVAHADELLERQAWACEEPYSGELECGPAMEVPPGAYLWVGQDTAGPNIFTAYSGDPGSWTRIGWGEMEGANGAFRLFTNSGTTTVLVHITEHADAPENRCGTRFESGFYEVRR